MGGDETFSDGDPKGPMETNGETLEECGASARNTGSETVLPL